MKGLFYLVVRSLCRVGAFFYFRGIEINGQNNIPKDAVVIYAPNHQNAFLDAILIGIFSPKPVSFFTRGDIFVKPYLWFLDALNMLPVYRALDGFSMAAQNEKTFDLAVQTLKNGKPLMIFPEANHDYPYTLRTLSKGTARIAFAAYEESKRPVYIVPVGLNYFRRHSARFKLIINYGKSIPISDHWQLYSEHKGKALTAVRQSMTALLKESMVIPEKDDKYEQRAQVFTRAHEKLKFSELKEAANRLDFKTDQLITGLKPIVLLLSIPNAVPLMLSKYVVSLFEDQVFEGSMKFGIAAIFCPIWFVLLYIFIGLAWNYNMSVIIVTACIVLLFARQELKRLYTETEHQFITKW